MIGAHAVPSAAEVQASCDAFHASVMAPMDALLEDMRATLAAFRAGIRDPARRDRIDDAEVVQ